jgi:hypothetical protein
MTQGDVLRELTVRAPGEPGNIGVNLVGGLLDHVRVETAPGVSQIGVYAHRGTIRDSVVVTPTGKAIDVQGDTPVILYARRRPAGRLRSGLRGDRQHLRRPAAQRPAQQWRAAHVLVAVDGPGSGGIEVGNGTLTGHHVTVVQASTAGPGDAGIRAAARR